MATLGEGAPRTATVCSAPLAPGTKLALARYRASFRMDRTFLLPEFAGSLLRGQFGAALRAVVCITGAPRCAGCALIGSCAYPQIFETPPPDSHRLQRFSSVPNAYVIEPPPGARRIERGETLAFEFVLLGVALRELPRVLLAFTRAFGQGLGRERARGELLALDVETPEGDWARVFSAGDQRLADHQAWLSVPVFGECHEAELHIQTPLRLQHNGRPLGPKELTARTLLTQLMRRLTLVCELHLGQPQLFSDAEATALASLAEALQDERELCWRDMTRYSARQKQEMSLGGVLGHWVLRGPIGPFMPLLWLGQWLHAGKNTTMGLGRYRLDPKAGR